jgi:hypothetical protein
MCTQRQCPECGDRLIHQLNRGPHESSSAFGQYVHDHIDKGVYWADVDGVIYKVGTRVLRVIEHKTRSGNLSKGQEAILPLLGMGIRSLAANELVHPQSGVYVVQSSPPFDTASVQQHRHWRGYPDGPPVEMRGDRWARFLAGEVDDDGMRAVS